MLKRIEFALRRRVMPSNMLESLAESFGEDKKFLADSERRAPEGMSYRDAIVFTNLVAEALIRDLDLKKGERVVLINPDPKDFFLLSIAIMKAGGMLVPFESGLDGDEIKRRENLVMANLGLLDGGVLNRYPDLVSGLRDPDRFLVSGPQVVEDAQPLYMAVGEGSGFFIPYTFKPTSVLALFFTNDDAEARPVMVTPQVFMSGSKVLGALLPLCEGDLVVSSAPLTTVTGFSAAMTALTAGMRLYFSREREGEGIWAEIEEKEPALFVGDPRTFEQLAAALPAAKGMRRPRVWFSTAPLTSDTVKCFVDSFRRGSSRLPPLFIESLCGPGTSGVAGIRLWAGARIRGLRVSVPPNRVRIADGGRRSAAGGEAGELLIKGPAVTPGFWNDLEESYATIRDGWLHTGLFIER